MGYDKKITLSEKGSLRETLFWAVEKLIFSSGCRNGGILLPSTKGPVSFPIKGEDGGLQVSEESREAATCIAQGFLYQSGSIRQGNKKLFFADTKIIKSARLPTRPVAQSYRHLLPGRKHLVRFSEQGPSPFKGSMPLVGAQGLGNADSLNFKQHDGKTSDYDDDIPEDQQQESRKIYRLTVSDVP